MNKTLSRTVRFKTPRLTPPRAALNAPRRFRSPARLAASKPETQTPAPVAMAPEAAHASSPTGDALQLYLREIGQVKLLTPKEEIVLAGRIMRRAEVRLRETLDREPTDEEVADDLGLDARRVRQYREASRAPLSLDSPIEADDENSISEIVADANAAAPFDRILSDNDNELVHEVLATLDARESKILAMRFGLDDGKAKTLEQVGEHFGVTRERIRQIQEEALQKMRVRIEQRDHPATPQPATVTE